MKSIQDLINDSKRKKMKQQKDNVAVNSDELPSHLSGALEVIKDEIGQSTDVVIREIVIGKEQHVDAAVVFIDGLIDKIVVHEHILSTLLVEIRNVQLNEEDVVTSQELVEILNTCSIPTGEMSIVSDFNTVFDDVLAGHTIILINGENKAISIDTKGWDSRSIEDPSSEPVVRGPKDGFTENLRTNTALIRRRIRDKQLVFEAYKVGKRSKTDVAVAYIKDIANEKIVQEVRDRINRINVDAILESGNIEEFIQDETYTPFPTIYNSERPDAIASGLFEGRIAIIVDGTPFVLLVPALFIHFMQSSEDYYQRADIATLLRILRFLAFLLSLLVPSAYIAVTTYHQEMLPTNLLISLSAQREGIPFPAFVEALIMEITFEILREGGIRMPRAVGSAISIVGALVLGQAAVEAGLISATMVIVVSLTAISSFVIPKFNMGISIRMIRFGFMVLAATFGLFGIMLGIIFILLHMTSLRSFGIPYMAPFGPFIKSDQKDSIIRLPQWNLKARPRLISQKDRIRQDTPEPEPGDLNEQNK